MSLQGCPILQLTVAQVEAVLSYCAMVRRLFEVGHPQQGGNNKAPNLCIYVWNGILFSPICGE